MASSENGMWLTLTTREGGEVYVNFAQVTAISKLITGEGLTRLHTGAGEIIVKEDLDEIRSRIPI